jgi:hypothetical protein
MNLFDSPLIINGVEYVLDDSQGPAHEQQHAPVQDGDEGKEFNERIENFARGWGASKQMEKNTYDRAETGILHNRLRFLPGSTVFEYTPVSPVPNGPVSFCEYWDGTDANRRLIAISPRYIYEIDSSGTVVASDLGATFTATRAMTKGVCFRNGATAAPRVYIARQSATATDYFIVRTAANTYSTTTANFRADAICAGKDSSGANVLWIVDPDANGGQLRQCVADADPQTPGSWGGTTYPVGEVSVRSNDLAQQAKRMVVARPDGMFTFDNIARSTPITPGFEQTKDADNGRYVKNFNGMAIVPTIAGLLWVDGLEWGMCGPMSSNRDAQALHGREVAFASAGDFVFAAIYDNTDSWIFLGTVRTDAHGGSGTGPFVWHGAVAKVQGAQVTDLTVSTVWGKRLWIGLTDGFAAILLNSDFTPVANEPSGYIYMPDGVLDKSGPHVTKQIDAVELIAPSAVAFSATNTWAAQFDFGDGNGWVSPGSATSGYHSKQTFATEKTSKRPKMRLAYSGNTGSAELEGVIVRGLERPDIRWHHVFRVLARDMDRTRMGARTWRHPQTVEDDLKALRTSGWTGLVKWGETSINGKVVDLRIKTDDEKGRRFGATRRFEVEIAEVP